MQESGSQPEDRFRIWLLPALTVLIGLAVIAGFYFGDRLPGLSPLPYLSACYLIASIDMVEPLPVWPLILFYCGAFLLWAFLLISYTPVRLNFTFFGPASLLVAANIAWLVGYGEANAPTYSAVLTSVLMPLALLVSGGLMHRRLRVNGVVILHGLLFAWFAYGSFPLLPGAP